MRTALLIAVLLIAAPAIAQDPEPDYLGALSEILAAGSGGSALPRESSPLDFGSPSQSNRGPNEVRTTSPLDLISGAPAFQAGSPLDFVSASLSNQREAVSASGSAATPSPLDFITGAYGGSAGYYNAGAWSRPAWGGNGFPAMTADYVLPANGPITSRFGYRPSFGRQHKGIDIAMPVGQEVRVALDGVVTRVSYEPRGYGNYIVVAHENGYETRYAHLSQPLVSIGQTVDAGQTIALSGNTGNSTGPHLHFETRHNGRPLDPTRLFAWNRGQLASQPASSVSPAAYGEREAVSASGYAAQQPGSPPASQAEPTRGTYVIRAGDNLSKISRKTGVTIRRLCQLNMLTESSTLQIGRMLRLR